MSKHESRRAAFEAKCGTRSIDRYSNGSYVDPFVSGAWGGWNAAQDEADKLRAELEALRKALGATDQGYCSEGGRCVCGGDTAGVRATCGSWIALRKDPRNG